MINYIRNYYMNRKKQSFYSRETSEIYKIQAGTPQGALSSPILFIFMLHDIPKRVGVNLHIYAGDINITWVSTDPTEIKDKLNGYLIDFKKWTENWVLLLSVQKKLSFSISQES